MEQDVTGAGAGPGSDADAGGAAAIGPHNGINI